MSVQFWRSKPVLVVALSDHSDFMALDTAFDTNPLTISEKRKQKTNTKTKPSLFELQKQNPDHKSSPNSLTKFHLLAGTLFEADETLPSKTRRVRPKTSPL